MYINRKEADRIRESQLPECILSTHVYKDWQVTTAYRQSSAMLCPDSWYCETFVWRLLPDKKRELIADATSVGHSAAVKILVVNNDWIEPEDE